MSNNDTLSIAAATLKQVVDEVKHYVILKQLGVIEDSPELEEYGKAYKYYRQVLKDHQLSNIADYVCGARDRYDAARIALEVWIEQHSKK